jgi:hypothetical protein
LNVCYDFSASTQKLTKFRHQLKKMRIFFGGYCSYTVSTVKILFDY